MRQYLQSKRWYWIFQLLGWGGFWVTQLQASFMLDRYEPGTLLWLTETSLLGLLLTHCYRALLLRYQVLRMPLLWQAGVAVLGLLGLSVSLHLLSPLLYDLLLGKWEWPYSGGWTTFTFGVVGVGRYLIVWVLA